MMTFMARLLHTPPSRFSRPSTVPLEVAGEQWRVEGEKEDGVTEMKRGEGMRVKRRNEGERGGEKVT